MLCRGRIASQSYQSVYRLCSLFAALLIAWASAEVAHADVVVKDTLDPANFEQVFYGGSLFDTEPELNGLSGRTFVGFTPQQSGVLASLSFYAVVFADNGSGPIVNPARSGVFDLNLALYQDLAEASAEQLRVDTFVPEAQLPQTVLGNPVGWTAPSDEFDLSPAQVFEFSYDFRSSGLVVAPGQSNYVGLSASGVPAGATWQLQRSDDVGAVLGGEPDYMRGSPLGPGLFALTDFEGLDGDIQTTARITITNFGDARDGDYNQDGTVNTADYTVWRDNFGATSGPGLIADGNVDGVVDGSDYAVWREYYGETVPTSATSSSLTVPEPTTLAIIAFAFGIAAVRRVGR